MISLLETRHGCCHSWRFGPDVQNWETDEEIDLYRGANFLIAAGGVISKRVAPPRQRDFADRQQEQQSVGTAGARNVVMQNRPSYYCVPR